MDVLINFLWESFTVIHISTHHVIHFKYFTILSVNYTSGKLRKKTEKYLQTVIVKSKRKNSMIFNLKIIVVNRNNRLILFHSYITNKI